jgi:hypothetical protein
MPGPVWRSREGSARWLPSWLPAIVELPRKLRLFAGHLRAHTGKGPVILRGQEGGAAGGLGICWLGWLHRLAQVSTHGIVKLILQVADRFGGLIQGRTARRGGDVAQVAIS